MTRPTWPPAEPPLPENEGSHPTASPEPGQPRFTPRPEAPGYPGAPAYPETRGDETIVVPPGYRPPPPPPPASSSPGGQPSPSFTPRSSGGEDRSAATGPRHGRPRPTFTPREGYIPPADRGRPAPAPTAFLPPVPAGYPQPSFQPYDYQDEPSRPTPRFVPADRGTGGHAAPGAEDNRTRILEPDAGPAPATGTRRASDDTGPNLARSSKAMAAGTLASRGTGFLRTFVFVYALGDATTADAYNTANTLPNTVYYLMLGGVFTSVVVPMLVRASKEDPDRGQGYAKRIYSLGVVALLVVTLLATLLARPIASLYGGGLRSPNEYHLTVLFAYFFVP